MIYRSIVMNAEGSMSNARLTTYIHEESDEMISDPRATVLVCPGGGYAFASEREGEPIAIELYNKGYNAAVLWYSVAPAVYPAALLEAGKAMQYLYDNASELGVDKDRLLVMGFSAGAHLAGNYACVWKERGFVKPAGAILCYPVITSGEYANDYSFVNLLGKENYEKMKDEVSLEKLVNKDNPPTFLWTTFEDDAVPAENAFLFAKQLRELDIPTELHMFAKGGHGLSLADRRTQHPEHPENVQTECTLWIDLLMNWLENI